MKNTMLDCTNANASVVMTIGVSSIGNDRMAVQCGGSVALAAVALEELREAAGPGPSHARMSLLL